MDTFLGEKSVKNISWSMRPITLPSQTCVFTIDVEDWFHIMDLPTAPQINDWDRLPSAVESNFKKVLDIVDEHGAKSTCFFLGWVAEHYPELVRAAVARGHEIASHGYGHGLVYEMTPEAFLEDVSKAKDLLENIIGRQVYGYRAPGFSVTAKSPWFFEILAKAGYRYDSSIFPAPRQHGGLPGFDSAARIIETGCGNICEVPISIARLLGQQICFFGGGYLRLFPYVLIQHMVRQVLDGGQPVVLYIHPREIDPYHPRLKMPLIRSFKSYVGLSSTAGKLDRLLSTFKFLTFAELLADSLRRDGGSFDERSRLLR